MFRPTHVVHIKRPDGLRATALQRTHSTASLEVFRDSSNAEFHQWGEQGVSDWQEYQIRALMPGEVLPAAAMAPVGPPAFQPFQLRGLDTMVAEPAMLPC